MEGFEIKKDKKSQGEEDERGGCVVGDAQRVRDDG
jgi:hypothetical protein